MDNFAHNRLTLDKIRLGKETLGFFTNGNVILFDFTRIFLPWINLTKLFYPC